MALENVRRRFATLGQALIDVLSPWENNPTEFLGFIIKDEMIIATVEVKASSEGKALHSPDDFINIGKRMRFSLKAFIELS